MGNIDTGMEQVRSKLRGVPYFADLDETTFQAVVQHVHIRHLPAGHTIFLKGEGKGEAPFYLVIEGVVRVYLSSLRGREQVLRLFRAGDTFGEVPLFDGGPFPASTEAVTDVVLAVVPRARMLALMTQYPAFAVGVVEVMAGRLRHFNALVEDLSLRRVIGRIARLLIDQPSNDLTQAQMAAMIGASREMVNRSLHRLEDDGIIAIDRNGSISGLDLERLARIVDEV